MKLRNNRSKKIFASLFAVMLGFLSISAAHAQILLTIDDSTPSSVIITATGSAPGTSVSPGLIAYGVDLVGLFTSNTNVGFNDFSVASTTLTTGDASSGPIFTQASGDISDYSISNVDLNLYHNNSLALISFTAGSAAFENSLTLNLSSTDLPAVGKTGDIVTIYPGSPETIIGQWEVVSESAPEPSTWALMLGGLGVLFFWRRRARQA